MAEEKTTSYWNMEVGALVRRLRDRRPAMAPEEERPPAEETTSAEARLRLVPRDGHLDFYSSLNPRRLFSLKATLGGALSKFSQGEGAGGRRIVLTVPLVTPDGQRRPVKVTFHAPRGFEPGDNLDLTRAGQGKLPPDTRLLEFLFTEGEQEFRYVVELDQRLEVLEFEEVVDRRPVFHSVPPVAQMTAFLRAITHQRRGAMAILASLKPCASEQARRGISLMQSLFRPSHEFGHPAAAAIQSLLARQERVLSLQVLHAFSLFLDLETGALPVQGLDELALAELPLSPEAALLVGEYFGLEMTPELWREAFPFYPDPLEEVRARAARPETVRALEKLNAQREQRTPVQILEQIAEESNSRRAGAFAAALKDRLPDGKLCLNDEQLALLALLSASGRRYQANTVVALCLFVDAEVGFLTEPDIEKMSRSAETVDTSMYAMVAVAGAFDVQLRGFVVGEGERDTLEAVVEQSAEGILAGFKDLEQSNLFWRWLRTAEEAREALSGPLQFTRMVLGHFAILDQLSEPDLAGLAEAGHDILACFQSDLDRSLVWRRLSKIRDSEWRTPLQEGRRTSFSFIEGFSAYHFSRQAMVELEKVEDEDLRGRRNVVAVYLDNRENRHYRCIPEVRGPEDLEPPEHSGWTWSRQVVAFPDVSGLPGTLRELGQEALLGRSEPLSRELMTLEWIQESLFQVLTRLPEYQSLQSRPDLLERIRKSLWSSRAEAMLVGLMDPRTRDGLSHHLKPATAIDFRIYRPLLEAEAGEERLEFLGLRLMYEMCRSDSVALEGWFKHYDAGRFRTLIHNRLCEMVDAEDPLARATAVRLLATAEEVPDASARLVVEYELSRSLGDPDPRVSRAAAEGLVRLTLMDVVPLPEMVELGEISLSAMAVPRVEVEAPAPATPGLDRAEVQRVDEEIRRWVKDVRLADPKRAAALPITDAEGHVVEERLAPLVEVLAGLNQACRLDESMQGRRYFCLNPAADTEAVRGAVLDSWKVMALSQGKRLADLVSEASPAEIFLDYRFFVEDCADALKRELGATPYLGGPGQPVTIHHFRPAEGIGVFRRRESSFVSNVMDESRFFLDLLELSRHEDPRQVRILRLTTAGGTPLEDLESHLAVFATERIVDPRTVEIFQLNRLRFAPLIHEMAFNRDQVGSEEEDLEDLQALLHLFQGKKHVRKAPREAPVVEAPPPPEPEPEPEAVEAPEAASSEEAPATEAGPVGEAEGPPARAGVRDLAARLRAAFGLPEEMERQVVNMLMAVGRSSMYDL